MGNVNAPASLLEMKEVETAARALSLEVDTIEIRKAEEIAPVFAMSRIALARFMLWGTR